MDQKPDSRFHPSACPPHPSALQPLVSVYGERGQEGHLALSVTLRGLPQWLSGKEATCNAGDPGLILGSGRSPGGGHGNPLQYSCLENPMDRGVWGATIHGVTQSRTQLKRVSMHTAH